VQRGRHGLELRVDGTLASALGDSDARPVWAALAAPVLLLPGTRRRRLLVLGLGGGTAAHFLRALAPRAEIVGVERDAGVARAARRHFGMDRLGVEVVVDDARHFLERERRRFDLVVEDVFVGPNRTIRKPGWLPEPGLGLAATRLSRGGLLAVNTIHEGRAVRSALLEHGRPLVRIGVAGYHNAVFVSGAAARMAPLARALREDPLLAPVAGALRVREVSGAQRNEALGRP
jgi:spermidine synthase